MSEITNLKSSFITPSDRSLVILVRDGDEDAAELLYNRYARRVLGLVKSQMSEKLSSATEPDDLVQSVFKSFFRKVQTGVYNAPPGRTLWNLIAVVAVNKVIRSANYHTAQCRDLERALPLEISGDAIDKKTADDLSIYVRELLEQLRPQDLQIANLRIDGHSVEEIATKVDRALRSVERSLSNTRQLFADELLRQD